MTIDEMERYAESIYHRCMQTLRDKNPDYARSDDALANFREVATQLAGHPATTEEMLRVWYTYAYKHDSAIARFIRDGTVSSEEIRGRVIDRIVYSVFLLALLAEEDQLYGDENENLDLSWRQMRMGALDHG